MAEIITPNAWQSLKQYTDARIGLGRAGVSLPTHHHLQFQLDHARARDAVLRPVDWQPLLEALSEKVSKVLELNSCAANRNTYLQRPDLGRQLDESSTEKLDRWRVLRESPVDVCIVIGDGLSATAVEQQAVPFVSQFLQDISATNYNCDLICCVNQCRVALGDEIAERTNAKFLVMLIGERPGLSAADSLGVYYTYLARRGCSDADRNCISNVRPKGQSFKIASERLLWLIQESDMRKLSGVKLKDDSDSTSNLIVESSRNLLLPDA